MTFPEVVSEAELLNPIAWISGLALRENGNAKAHYFTLQGEYFNGEMVEVVVQYERDGWRAYCISAPGVISHISSLMSIDPGPFNTLPARNIKGEHVASQLYIIHLS